MSHSIRIFFVMFCFTFVVQSVSADDWPQWRGANLDSISSEKNLPKSLNESSRLWKLEMPGPAGSSPIVFGDKIFAASVDGNDLVLMCVSTDGELVWKQKLEGQNKQVRMDRSNYASPSPVTDGKHVWVMLSDGVLHCFTVDGELVWKKNMQDEYGKFKIQFGMSSTPLLDKGKLYFQFIHGVMRNDETSEGHIVALNAESGDEVWKHLRTSEAIKENKHSYTSPVLFRNAEREYLVIHGADYATGHSLEDGKEIWRVGGFNPPASYNKYLRFVSSPVCSKSMIVVPSAKKGPVIAINPAVKGDVSENGEGVIWKMERGTPDVASPVISEDRVFLASENGIISCLDAKSGEKLFEERLLRDKHRSTPVVADGRVYIVGRDGTVIVLDDNSEFKLISQTDLGEDTTASPAIANGRIYIRTNKSLMAFGSK